MIADDHEVVRRGLRALLEAIVVLTMEAQPAFARDALSAGAAGYVLKDAADNELVEAVRRARRGELYLNPRLGARIDAITRSEMVKKTQQRSREERELPAQGGAAS